MTKHKDSVSLLAFWAILSMGVLAQEVTFGAPAPSPVEHYRNGLPGLPPYISPVDAHTTQVETWAVSDSCHSGNCWLQAPRPDQDPPKTVRLEATVPLGTLIGCHVGWWDYAVASYSADNLNQDMYYTAAQIERYPNQRSVNFNCTYCHVVASAVPPTPAVGNELVVAELQNQHSIYGRGLLLKCTYRS